MIDKEKNALRIKYKKIRADIKDKKIFDSSITEAVLNSHQYKNADKIFAYWSVGSEVDTHNIIKEALSDNKKVALPKCIDTLGNMQFYYINSLSDLSVGMYGIAEPKSDLPAEDYTAESLCLVPGLSFDRYGYRLGYGKGYYDRFLVGFTGMSFGLCYEDCLSEKLPSEIYDKKVNYIFTNTNIFKIKEE